MTSSQNLTTDAAPTAAPKRPRTQTSNTLLLSCAAIATMAFVFDSMGDQPAVNPNDSLPNFLVMNAVVRDFKAKADKGGHPDFQAYGNSNITTGLVDDRLDADSKPVFKTTRGQEITANYLTSTGRIINPKFADTGKSDKLGTLKTVSSDQLTSADLFKQWYRDTNGVNVSKLVPLIFNRVPGTNRYLFDSAVDEPYKSRGGFFPINSDGFGNYASTGKNFHFTTEIETRFVYQKSDNLVFTFTGDDDVWVYIDNQLVLDLGGLHPRKEQSIELNRLSWLKDKTAYTLKVFHAERATNESNFRIETNIMLVPAELPPTAGLAD
jgi:fibro-slime domain-containing protein